MKTTLDNDSGTSSLPVRTVARGRDARAIRARGKKPGPLFATKEFWRVLSSASLPHAPKLRRLHD